MKRLLKDKRGMSLMEILVAFSLLMIVIVGTTPVMLSAYDGLYTAGEYTQDTYDAKTEIEDQLATRNSTLVLENFVLNFDNLGTVAKINATRAVSSLVASLESVFTGRRTYLTIVSGNTVNDDAPSHEITVQISNYNLKSFDEICDSQNWTKTDKSKRLIFNVIIPSKSSTANSEEIVYSDEDAVNADVEVVRAKSNLELGRITIKVDGDFDFTKSPLKIQIYYYDEDENLLSTADYLHIKAPTIIAAGVTKNFDYYTTAGVAVETDENVDGREDLKIVGRKMNTSNASGTMSLLGSNDKDADKKPIRTIPYISGETLTLPELTTIKSVNWVTEYDVDSKGNQISPNTSYETSYYVLTGTNGAIYRSYIYTAVDTVVGKGVTLPIDSGDNNAQTDFNNNRNGVSQSTTTKVVGPTDAPYDIKNGAETVYPAVWGGDFSHVFMYATYGDDILYVNDDVWQTEDGDTGKGIAGYYSNKANFSYWYSGYGTSFDFSTQNSKTLSYILTEIPYALRVGGYLESSGNYDRGLTRIWERPIIWKTDGSFDSPDPIKKDQDDYVHVNYYKNINKNETFTRCAIATLSKWYYGGFMNWEKFTNHYYRDNFLNQVPTYFGRYNDSNAKNLWGDDTFAQLRLKGLTTISPTFFFPNRNSSFDGYSDRRFGFNNETNQTRINVTDSVFIPGTGMFYVGTVAAYGVINQLDNVNINENYAAEIRQPKDTSDRTNRGGMTTYYVMGNDSGTATTIHKYSSSDMGRDESLTENSNLTIFKDKSQVTTDGIKANSPESREFFVTRSAGSNKSKLFNDVLFTLGFTSNREMVYTNIVYGETEEDVITESFKSYEGFYFKSHWDDVDEDDPHYPTLAINDFAATKKEKPSEGNYTDENVTTKYRNSVDNDFYNVWFPGEMYNLTKVASKSGVTVAVGYAVSGSTYTWINPSQKTNGSTALGNIHNDGVLAIIVDGEDTAFNNLLYFKDNDGFDKTSLTTLNSTNYSQLSGIKIDDEVDNTGYGTHARHSVQFTAVDISVEPASSNTEKYYAYYADNRGRIFRSLVATKKSDGSIDRVTHIADEAYDGTRTAPSYMQEQKIGTQSIGDYLEKVTSINVAGDYIYVTGHPKDGTNNFYIIVGKMGENGAAPTWKAIVISNTDDPDTNANESDIDNFLSNDGLVLEGYLYVVGSYRGTDAGGWINATKVSDIEASFVSGDAIPHNAEGTADPLYAIDGHS